MRKDEYYEEIMTEWKNEKRKEVTRRNKTYRTQNELLVVHLENQIDNIQYWTVVVP